jgi:hypothetical protein
MIWKIPCDNLYGSMNRKLLKWVFKKGLQQKKDLIHIIKPEWGRNEIAQKVSKTSFKIIVSLTNGYLMCVSLVSVYAYFSFASW